MTRITWLAVLAVGTGAGLQACSSGGGTGTAPPPSLSSKFSGSGRIQVSGRVNSSDLPATAPAQTAWPAGTPDDFTVVADEIALSSDGKSYSTVVPGPITLTFSAASDRPIVSSPVSLPAGEYQAMRLKLNRVDWHATWTHANPSPCSGATSGEATGNLNLAGNTTYYYETGALGGNTPLHYAAKPLLLPPNYIGDANNPLLLTAPLIVTGGNTSTMDLVLSANKTLVCSNVSAYSMPSDLSPPTLVLALEGPQTGLSGAAGVYLDTDADKIGVVNAVADSLTLYDATAAAASSTGNLAPAISLSGPATRLNQPEAVLWYKDPNGASGNRVIVANAGNNSVSTYNVTGPGGNLAPERTIGGVYSDMAQPAGLAMHPDPNGDVNGDELWVADRGGNEVASYVRLGDKDLQPANKIFGPQTLLNTPCGIALSSYDPIAAPHERILVANNKLNNGLDQDRITVYDRSAVIAAGNTTGDVAPVYIIEGADTGLSQPCGMAVDDSQGYLYVANLGNGTVTAYSLADLFTGKGPDLTAVQTKTLTGLSGPRGLLWDGTQQRLWVTQRSATPTMNSLPLISAVSGDADTASSPLTGKYNVVAFGADLKHGTNQLGIPIATPFAERGTLSLTAAGPNLWPSASLNVDTLNIRQIIEPKCSIPFDTNVDGFYDTTTLNGLNMFLGPAYGAVTGVYSTDGQYFAGTSYEPGSHMFLIMGIRDTGGTTPKFGTGGATTYYEYGQYQNRLLLNRFSQTQKYDLLTLTSEVGTQKFVGNQLVNLFLEAGFEGSLDPMGDFATPQLSASIYRNEGQVLVRPIDVKVHAGGQVELPGDNRGLVGAAAANGDMGIFMTDRSDSNLDGDGCPTELGYGIALKTAAAPMNVTSLKGTYYLAAFGDTGDTLSTTQRPAYRVVSGTITFDGRGNGQLALTESDDGDISLSADESFIYNVKPVQKSGAAVNVVQIFKAASDLNPIATLIPGPNARTLLYYDDLFLHTTNSPNDGNGQRLMGLAIYQGA